MCHSLRKCSRDQKLWSTDWLKLGTEVGCDEIIFISKTTLAHFWEFKFWSFRGGGGGLVLIKEKVYHSFQIKLFACKNNYTKL